MLRASYTLAAERGYSPVTKQLVRLGLDPKSHSVYRPNKAKLQKFWASIVREAYERDLPEDCTPFWACLRRAFPDAMSDEQQWEQAVSNACLLFSAGLESTGMTIALVIAALTIDTKAQDEVAEARNHNVTASISRFPNTGGPECLQLLYLALGTHACCHKALHDARA